MVNHGFIVVTSQRSIVVGGGVAGIAAAWRLAKAGHQVTLVESRHALGGRARSFPDPVEKGRLVDSCQHVVMGCCSSLLALLRQMGLSGLLRPHPVIHFLSHGGRRSRFEASRLPPPGHLAWALAGLHHLGVADKAGIAASIASLAVRGTGTAPTFGEWLARRGQGARVVRDFWDLVIVSALNQPSAGACPRLARKVFIDGFLAARDSHELRLPIIPLEDLFHRHMGERLAGAGVRILTATDCKTLLPGRGRVTGIALRDGARLEAETVVLAVPWERLPALLAGLPGGAVRCRGESLRRAGIAAVHLWFDRRVLPTAHAALVGATAQWLFRHPLADAGDGYLQAVVSGIDETNHDAESLANAVIGDIGRFCPASRRARLIKSKVVRENLATFRVPPGVENDRPRPGIVFPGLAIAGDWTGTGWPATMEGACRSGIEAATALLAPQGC
jgi:zeta-carotene desaturase